MELRTVKTGDLIPYEHNPRNNEPAVEAVMESIKQCGYISPIIVDEDMVVLAGHTRLKALERMGVEEVQIGVAAGLTEDQKRKFRILDNKTNEFAEWDFATLENELYGLDFGDFDFSFDFGSDVTSYEERKRTEQERSAEWFNDHENGKLKEGDTEEYAEFLDKFEQKKTTDDCYTPKNIYSVIEKYVSDRYGEDAEKFVRPFYPGGDYQKYEYAKDCVVVDNPPFSILSEITNFYNDNGIKFFLFAPALTLFGSSGEKRHTSICVGASIEYENGAKVATSFLTNMDGDVQFRSDPELFEALKKANNENVILKRGEQRKFEYPAQIATSARVQMLSKYGIEYSCGFSDCIRVSHLDSQKECGDSIFGGGYMLSEKAAAEKAAAEKPEAKPEVWELSEREMEIIKKLGL